MEPLRRWLLIVAPLPILSASWSVTHWTAPPGDDRPERNRFESADVLPRITAFHELPHAQNVAAQRLLVECERQAEHWHRQLGPECAWIVRPPYVIAGDLSSTQLDVWYRSTILPASEALNRSYFATPPTSPVTVLLWSTESSYQHYSRRLFGDEGISIYGYYRHHLRTLTLNIGTGGGTLVHELTHALAAFDFPMMPEWFNEGLASLHEACRIRDDRSGLDGLLNWRLEGLQQVIRLGQCPSLAKLVARSDFRGPQAGLNYAQARYLCLFLQERGLLVEFYRTSKRTQHEDPTGRAALISLFEHRDWSRLDREFQQWVVDLRRE